MTDATELDEAAIRTRYAPGHRHHSARIGEVRLLLTALDEARAQVERVTVQRDEARRNDGNEIARSMAAECALAALRAVADDLAAYDCTKRPTPQGISAPDDYEAGLHRAAAMIRAALVTTTTTKRSE